MVADSILGRKGDVASRFRHLDLVVSSVGSFGQQGGVATDSEVSACSGAMEVVLGW